MSVELGNHQIEAVSQLDNGKILKGGVGSGKSRASIAYYVLKECRGGLKVNGKGERKSMEDPKDLYIITTAKKRDSKEWEDELIPFGLTRKRETSFDNVQVEVDSWNNITKYADVRGAMFIFDEQRLVGSGAWVKAFLEIAKHNRWIILSGTPGDVWMDYIPVFLANGFYKNRTEFIRRHVVMSPYSKFPKVDRYVEQGRLYAFRKQILIDMPLERHTKRHIHQVICDYDEETYTKVFKGRWNVFKDQPIKNIAEMCLVARHVVNGDPSRLEKLDEIRQKHPRLIVFYNFNRELEGLRKFAEDRKIPYAEWNGHKHQEIPDTESWLYFVQYTAGAEGWNCVSTDAMVMSSLNYSWKLTEQARGRIDRMNTPFTDLHYYQMRSNAPIDRAIHKALLQKKNFNERSLGITFDPEP